jgi:membrane-bound lytic murein transglycosylase D
MRPASSPAIFGNDRLLLVKSLKALFILLFLAPAAFAPAAFAADSVIPRPAELEPDVAFWIRVYSAVSTNEGYIHDMHDLSVVYETMHFASDATPREREAVVDAARDKYTALLKRFASGELPATDEEKRVRALWSPTVSAERLQLAATEVRFQLGQSDRFRAGIMRSGAWETHIAEALANSGLPPELAALPHVESSFDPAAYSKVGAAGLWQFMRSTGRRFLRIDRAVDERMDPFRASEAAAQLLSYNYRVLGTWPLAITAYNHGAAGMRRAIEQVGSEDIVKILREYKSPSFGFASRNFYVSFLAALTIDQNPEKYFGPVQRTQELQFREVPLATAANPAALERALGVKLDTLRELNPALLPTVWNGKAQIPREYRLRLPDSVPQLRVEQLALRLGTVPNPPTAATVATDEGGPSYVVAAGDTLSSIANANKLNLKKLMAANNLTDQDHIYEGQRILLAAKPVKEPPAEQAAEVAAVAEAHTETQAVAAAAVTAQKVEPVSAAQEATQSPALVPADAGALTNDPFDYSVLSSNTIVVATAETLGHYADWLGSNPATIRKLNNLGRNTPVVVGRKLRLEFGRVSAAQFEQKRRDYHQQLQAQYFAAHRITGTEVYIARRGDSLWSLTKRAAGAPVWLLQQYNPDLNFSALRPGVQIVLPKVEDLAGV